MTKLEMVYRSQFKRDYRLMSKRGLDVAELERIMIELANKNPLPPNNKDHALIGNYIGFRECHIAPDFLLIYSLDETHIYFTRTGTHSDLF